MHVCMTRKFRKSKERLSYEKKKREMQFNGVFYNSSTILDGTDSSIIDYHNVVKLLLIFTHGLRLSSKHISLSKFCQQQAKSMSEN